MEPHPPPPAGVLPEWLPERFRHYLSHVSGTKSLRSLARDAGVHASTVLRQVRRCENLRDDPLLDLALMRLSETCASQSQARSGPGRPQAEENAMRRAPHPGQGISSGAILAPPGPTLPADLIRGPEAARVLRRLCEPGALMAFASDMEKAVVLREAPGGASTRSAVVTREMAEAFALQAWITCRKPGRVATYSVTPAGRAALRQMMAEGDSRAFPGLSGRAAPFRPGLQIGLPQIAEGQAGAGGIDFGETGEGARRPVTVESPIAVLARRRGKDGGFFLTPDLVRAAERLREDFELAQLAGPAAPDWQQLLLGGAEGAFRTMISRASSEGPARAAGRVAAALQDLGPGLGDIALQVCCNLEGVEAAEQRMGWAARSGKIVLRIALTRLRRHYDETCGRGGPMIG